MDETPETDEAEIEPKFILARCRTPSGMANAIRVLDVSATGCLIDKRALSLKSGDRVLIKLEGLEFFPASVLWIEEDRAGLSFERALYEPVLNHLRRAFDA